MKPRTEGRYFPLLATSIIVVLIWILSFADPCLIAALRGGPPDSANPIAVTSCVVSDAGVLITRGDVIVRVAALVPMMGLFGVVGGLLDPTRRKRSFAGISALGATCGFAIYVTVQFVFLYGAILSAYHIVAWALCAVVGSLASMLGAALAESTVSE